MTMRWLIHNPRRSAPMRDSEINDLYNKFLHDLVVAITARDSSESLEAKGSCRPSPEH